MILNNYVLDSVAASGGDISLTGGVLSIQANATTVINLPTRLIMQLGQALYPVQGYLLDQAQISTVTYIAAANTTFAFYLRQPTYDLYSYKEDVISFTTDSTNGTDANIATVLTAIINKQFPHLTVSGSASPLTITGGTGYPVYTIQAVSNVAIAAAQTVRAPNATPATALAGTTTVTVTTLAAHGLLPGNTVTITSATGFTFTRNGVATVATIVNARIATVPSSTTFTLDGVTGAGTNTGTIVVTVVAQQGAGSAAQVTTNTGIATTAGASYGLITLFAGDQTINSGIQGQAIDLIQYNLWINATTSATNYLNYISTLRNRLDGLTANASGADSEWVAV